MGSGPAGDVEGAGRVSAARAGLSGVVCAQSVLDDAMVHGMSGAEAVLRINEKSLAADGTAHI
jgi:hypothetical protein